MNQKQQYDVWASLRQPTSDWVTILLLSRMALPALPARPKIRKGIRLAPYRAMSFIARHQWKKLLRSPVG